jgi:hypothetical protein
MSGRKNLRIVFLQNDGRDEGFGLIRKAADRSDQNQKRWQMRPNLRRPDSNRSSSDQPIEDNNSLISSHYFFGALRSRGESGASLNVPNRNLENSEAFLTALSENAVRQRRWFVYFRGFDGCGDDRATLRRRLAA